MIVGEIHLNKQIPKKLHISSLATLRVGKRKKSQELLFILQISSPRIHFEAAHSHGKHFLDVHCSHFVSKIKEIEVELI